MANAGTHPEPMHLAAGILRAGHKVSYWTASSWQANAPIMRLARSRAGRSFPLSGLVRRRGLPTALSEGKVRRFASMRELRYQYLIRKRPSEAIEALKSRTARFRAQAARALAKKHPNVDCIIAQQTSAHDLFVAAPPGARRVLMYPIAHHRWMADYLGKEAEANPAWAPYLQGHDRTPEEIELMDREIELADLIVVASSFVRKTFESQEIPAEKMIVIPLGASGDGLMDGGETHDLPSSELNVLFVGQITQRKGVSYLLDGFRTAAVQGSVLTFVGRPVGGIEHAIPNDLDIQVLPPRSREALGTLYRDADVLVLPSLAEGFGLVAIEAMTCGTPCILSEKTFGHDVIEEGVDGYVVPARDADAVAAKLRTLADDPALLEAMGAAARTKASMYTWDRYVDSVAKASFTLVGA